MREIIKECGHNNHTHTYTHKEMASTRPWFDQGDPESVIELTDIIDEGSSGAVFEGKLKTSERVAVKVIPGLDDKAVENEIHEEIKILRKIASSSPYLVGFKGAWEKEEGHIGPEKDDLESFLASTELA